MIPGNKLVIYLAVSLLFCIPVKATAEKKYKIGFSQCTTKDYWRQTQGRLMQTELSFYPELSLEIKDADNDNARQVAQIEEFLQEGIDLLIVSPNESAPLTPVVAKVFRAGIPVIIIDRNINSGYYTAFIGGDNYEIGAEAGMYAARLLKGKGKILEITGLTGSSPAIERSKGFRESLKKFPEMVIVSSLCGEWNWKKAGEVTEQAIHSEIDFDLIYAHNDVMAREARTTLRRFHNPNGRYILGIDGLGGKEAGIQFVLNKEITATFLYPTGGEIAIQVAHSILSGKPFRRTTILPTLVIDSSNVKILKGQTDQVEILQTKIEKLGSVVDIQLSRYRIQQYVSLLLVIIVILSVTVVFVIMKVLKNSKRFTLELIKSRAELERANLAKSEFLSRMSHELRTPLNSILGFAQLLNIDKPSPSQKNKIDYILHGGKHLLEMINEILDLSKIEAGKLVLKKETIYLQHFLPETVNLVLPFADNHEISVEIIEHNHFEAIVETDAQRLRQIMLNLITNAVKYNRPGGKVFISIQQISENSGHPSHIAISVTDTGIGISAENISRLFNPFERIDADKIHEEGTGLGLAVVKKLVEAMNGKIEVESQPEIGSTFRVIFPAGANQ